MQNLGLTSIKQRQFLGAVGVVMKQFGSMHCFHVTTERRAVFQCKESVLLCDLSSLFHWSYFFKVCIEKPMKR